MHFNPSYRNNHLIPTGSHSAANIGQICSLGLADVPGSGFPNSSYNLTSGTKWSPDSSTYVPQASRTHNVNTFGNHTATPNHSHLEFQAQRIANPAGFYSRSLDEADLDPRVAVGSQFVQAEDTTAILRFGQDYDADSSNIEPDVPESSPPRVRSSSPWNPLQQRMASPWVGPNGMGGGSSSGQPLGDPYNLPRGITTDTPGRRPQGLRHGAAHSYGMNTPGIDASADAAYGGLESHYGGAITLSRPMQQQHSSHTYDVGASEPWRMQPGRALKERLPSSTQAPTVTTQPSLANCNTSDESNSLSHCSDFYDGLRMSLYNASSSAAVPTDEFRSFETTSAGDLISPQWETPTSALTDPGSSIAPSLLSQQVGRCGMSADGSINCPFCGWGSSAKSQGDRRSNVNRHIRQKHSRPEGARFECPEAGCLKTFARSDYVRRHQRASHRLQATNGETIAYEGNMHSIYE